MWPRAPLAFGAILVVWVIVTLTSAEASPWPRPPGDVLLITQSEYFHGTTDRDEDVQQLGAMVYGEAGLSDQVTIGGTLYYTLQDIGGPFASTAHGLATAEAFIQRQMLKRGNTVVSTKLTYAAETAMARVYATGAPEQDGQDGALEPALLIGRSFADSGTVFAGAELGYRVSLGGDADRLEAEIFIGAKPAQGWMLLLKSMNSTALNDSSPARPFTDYSVYRLEPSVTYAVAGGLSLSVGLRQDIGGSDIATGTALFTGLWGQF